VFVNYKTASVVFQVTDKHIDPAHKERFVILIQQAVKLAKEYGEDGVEHEA
jgi:hypothetical protein